MADVIDRVENAATTAMADFARDPYRGGRPAVAIPDDAVRVAGEATGYVTHIDVAALGDIARREGLAVHVAVLPGAMVHPARALMRVTGGIDDDARAKLIAAFTIERHRTFDQDPRLGLIALSEIASRALAPATNDPGTAIEVLNALLRVLLCLPADEPGAVADRPHVYLPRPTVDEMLTDAFRPILREGGNEVEVTIRLTHTLAALHAGLPGAHAPIRALAEHCATRARRMMDDPDDLAAFESAHRLAWDG